MGLEEMLLDHAKREGIKEGLSEGLEKGWQKGAEATKHVLVKNLLSNTDFSIEKIANLAAVSEEFVQRIKAQH